MNKMLPFAGYNTLFVSFFTFLFKKIEKTLKKYENEAKNEKKTIVSKIFSILL